MARVSKYSYFRTHVIYEYPLSVSNKILFGDQLILSQPFKFYSLSTILLRFIKKKKSFYCKRFSDKSWTNFFLPTCMTITLKLSFLSSHFLFVCNNAYIVCKNYCHTFSRRRVSEVNWGNLPHAKKMHFQLFVAVVLSEHWSWSLHFYYIIKSMKSATSFN